MQDPEAQQLVDGRTFTFAPFWGDDSKILAQCAHLQPALHIGCILEFLFARSRQFIEESDRNERHPGAQPGVVDDYSCSAYGLRLELAGIASVDPDSIPEKHRDRLRLLQSFRKRHAALRIVGTETCAEVCSVVDSLILYCEKPDACAKIDDAANECANCTNGQRVDHSQFEEGFKAWLDYQDSLGESIASCFGVLGGWAKHVMARLGRFRN